ncbi:tetratricopeptide repeat protein [Rubrivirga sp. IMCC43871]|uniref:tetratricopeptide repeat protein n=1 Tax=Rubrivirga sp. IMCC43871 TaxID=3391575 RepID=UPI003990137D
MDLVRSYCDSADALYDEGRLELAAERARRALELREALDAPGAPEIEEVQNLLGIVLSDLGEFEEARDLYARALATAEAKGEASAIAAVLNNAAELAVALGDSQVALQHLERAVRLWTDLHGEHHPHVATALVHRGLAEAQLGEDEAARASVSRALAIREEVLDEGHPDIGRAAITLAAMSESWGSRADEALARRGFDILRARLGPRHPDVASAAATLAGTVSERDPAAAIELLDGALEVRRDVLGPEHPDVGYAWGELGRAYRAAGRHDDAQRALSTALAVITAALGEGHPSVAQLMSSLGAAALDAGDVERAETLLRRALDLLEVAHGPDHPLAGDTVQMLAVAALDRGAPGEARALFDRSLELMRGDEMRHLAQPPLPRRPFSPRLATLRRAAEAFRRGGRLDDAEVVAREALEMARRSYGDAHLLTAETANDLAVVLVDRGALADAHDMFDAALRGATRLVDDEERRRAVGVVSTNWAGAHRRGGSVSAARDLLVRALAEARALMDDGGLVSTMLSNLSLVHRALGEPERALSAAQEAVDRQLASRGAADPDTARAQMLLADALVDVPGRSREGVELARTAHSALAASLGQGAPDTAEAAGRLALLLLDEDPAASVRLLEDALAVYRGLGDDVEAFRTEGTLGLACQAAGRVEEAETALTLAAAGLERELGEEHPDVALALNNLGLFHFGRGDSERAEGPLRRALAIREAILGEEHPDLAESVNNVAGVHHERGDYLAARPLLERAFEIREASLGAVHPDVAAAAINLGVLLSRLGDNARARPLLERALSIWEEQSQDGAGTPLVAVAADNLAMVLYDDGEDERCIELITWAMEIREQLLGPMHPDVAQSLNNLALTVQDLGDLEAAEGYHRRALAIREQALGLTHPDVAQSLNNLGGVVGARGDLEAARDLYRRSIRIWQAAVGAGGLDEAMARINLARADAALAGPEAAAADVLRAAETVEAITTQQLGTLSVAERLAWNDDLPQTMSSMLMAYAMPVAPARAYGLLAGLKGGVLAGLLGLGRGHAEAARRLRAVREEIGRAVQDDRASDVDGLEHERERLERSLLGTRAHVEDGVWDRSGAARLAAGLPDDAAFVDLYCTVDWPGAETFRYTAVVTAGGEHATVDLGPADVLDDALAAWRREVVSPLCDLDALAERVWAPIGDVLSGSVGQVWVCPEGPLWGVPWGLFGGDRRVAVVPSPRLLLALQAPPPPPQDEVLLVAGPTYGAVVRARGLGDLPSAGAESACVEGAAAASGRRVVPLTGPDATVGSVCVGLETCGHAHIATHGLTGTATGRLSEGVAHRGAILADPGTGLRPGGGRWTRSPLATSALVLAGDDPYLTAEQVVGLSLGGLQSVVLSACSTGLGRWVSGQGVLGLAAAFHAAGVRWTLASLWDVPDAATLALVEGFYAALWGDGRSPADALRAAQAQVRAHRDWRAPFFWAGWVLSGDAFHPAGA